MEFKLKTVCNVNTTFNLKFLGTKIIDTSFKD